MEQIQHREEEPTQVETTERLGKDEMWVRHGNNKKWREPAKDARRKKMAKASKKRNRK